MSDRHNNVIDRFGHWLDNTTPGDGVHEELTALQEMLDTDRRSEAETKIHEAFYKELEFGTGGLRGILGAGTNRMNIYTVGKATQGLADYVLKHFPEDPSVAVSYDTRILSKEFADTAAQILSANGIRVWMYPETSPTPMLSFAVRHYKASAGIMVTASHNPSMYNGYKAYNDEGCQLTSEAADEVLECIHRLDPFKDVRRSGAGAPITMIDQTVVDEYIEAVLGAGVPTDCKDLEVVFSPLNGSGLKPVLRILEEIGVGKVHVVESQREPDGNFPTCSYPNPEKKEALAEGLALCRRLETPDLLMATDPDGDRIGIAVCEPDTQWWEPDLLTGNEVGLLLLDFLCANKELPEDPIVIKTIVTSNMVREICGRYGLEMREVLTGFKYIGEIIGQLERDGQEDRYFFGFEESYGYLSGSYVRDKDAVNGAMLICQMAAHYKARGMTLTDRLKELYDQYGYYVDDIAEFAFEGSAGMAAMAAVLGSLRRDPPEDFAGSPVESFIDYMHHDTGLPRSEVLRYTMANGAGLIARPSGTEPKLKVYLSAKEKSKEASLAATQKMKDEISEYIGKNNA